MRFAAALILTLASSVALADQPAGYIASTDLFDWRESATQLQRQPISGNQGEIIEYQDGNDYWVRSPSTQVDGSDFLNWQRGMRAPGLLETMDEEEDGL